jgi:hypothetical protein
MTRAIARRLCGLAAGAAVASTAIAPVTHAQPSAAAAMDRAQALVAALEQADQCDLSLHGTAQLDEPTGRWLIAYSGAGTACDDASAALQQQGIPADIAFFRRPNADEVKVLIGRMRASVRRGFDCLISFNGEPRFDDESTVWAMRYYTSGHQCDDAAEELERQGREYSVSFRRFR